MLSGMQLAEYHREGYLIVRGFLAEEERSLLSEVAHRDGHLAASMVRRLDAQGGTATLALDNDLHDDIYSAICRSDRMVGAIAQILDDEPYHYHHKVSAKQPFEGGAWEWHQDYGYWYNNGCLFPNMVSCYVAIDAATRENGCMQLIAGSHLMGRVEHGKSGDQTGADMERVEQALKRLPLVYAELEPGDALFFHCNTLHRSDQNRSPHPRWGLICCYNARSNDPYKQHGHPCYSYLERWPDERIVEIGRRDACAAEPAAVV
jgi:ectoine hydroxylase-related dioxygenase (phytanoyl-CoA dioxygenase family)